MRKRTVNHLADTIFWYLLYFLPVLAYLLNLLCSTPIVSLESFLSQGAFSIANDNLLLTTFNSIFGASGIFPLFSNTAVISVFVYFISVYICHLLVDFCLFVPRLCHKWLKTFTQGE